MLDPLGQEPCGGFVGEQIEAEQQQAMMAQATQAAAPGFMDAAMKAASQNPNQGTE